MGLRIIQAYPRRNKLSTNSSDPMWFTVKGPYFEARLHITNQIFLVEVVSREGASFRYLLEETVGNGSRIVWFDFSCVS